MVHLIAKEARKCNFIFGQNELEAKGQANLLLIPEVRKSKTKAPADSASG